jgi:hypothetical protein
MLYFFKYKLLFNFFYNEHKSIQDCSTILREKNFNFNFNICGSFNQRNYKYNSSFLQNDLYIIFNFYIFRIFVVFFQL